MLFGRHLTLMGSWMGTRRDLVEVLRFVADGGSSRSSIA